MEILKINTLIVIAIGLATCIGIASLIVYAVEIWLQLKNDDYNEVKFQGNSFMCNARNYEVFESFDYEFFDKKIKSIDVTYNDGIMKQFDLYTWPTFGVNLLKNCKGLTVTFNYK